MDQSNLLQSAYEQEIRPFIDIVDELRACGLKEDIDLPTVVVLGDQSSGKSSILEAISNVQLPRGSGMVTRCPLELQLKKVKSKSWKGTLSYKKQDTPVSQELTNPLTVEKSIRDAQNDLAGMGRSISSTLLTLRIESNDSPDLTLIDLPGITRLALEGQDPGMPEQIRRLVNEYILKENALILCAISGELDIAVNESIRMARDVDPTGNRTLAVITKPDLIAEESKSEKLRLLNNELVPLKKGFSMVLCRSFKDIQNGVSLSEALDKEVIFFQTDETFKDVDPHLLGSRNLSLKLTRYLVDLIKEKIGGIKKRISTKIEGCRKDLNKFALAPPKDENEKMGFYVTIAVEYLKEMENLLMEGIIVEKDENAHDATEKKINVFCEWREICSQFRKTIDEATTYALASKYSDLNLASRLKMERGEELAGFLNYTTFKEFVREHIQTYKNAAQSLVDKIRENIEESTGKITKKNFLNYYRLQTEINTLVGSIIIKQYEMAMDKIDFHFQEEMLVFTQDECFLQDLATLENKLKEKEKEQEAYGRNLKNDSTPLKQKKREIEEDAKDIHNMLSVYFAIANRRLADNMTCCVRLCLQNLLFKALKPVIYNQVSRPDIMNMLREDPFLAVTRENLANRLKRLQAGFNKLASFHAASFDPISAETGA